MSEVDLRKAAKTKPVARAPTETVEHALRSAIDVNGADAFHDGNALEVFLSRRCPDAGNDIALLRIGFDEQVPQALAGPEAAQDLDGLARQLQQRLSDRRSLNRYAAAWIVKTWTEALRLRAEAPPATIPDAVPSHPRPAVAAPTPAVGPTPATAPRPPPTSTPPRARAAILPSSAGASRWVRIGIAISAMVVITIVTLFESRMSGSPPAAFDTASSMPDSSTGSPDAKPSTPGPTGLSTATNTNAGPPAPPPIVSGPVAPAQPSPSPSAVRRDEGPVATNEVAPSRRSPACTRTTCGSVVAVHVTGSGAKAVGASSRSEARPDYEIIVRMDDRAIQTFRQPTMLKTGARAKVVDGKLLVMNAAPSARAPYREGQLVPESEPAFSP